MKLSARGRVAVAVLAVFPVLLTGLPEGGAPLPDPLEAAGYDLPARMEALNVPGVSIAVFDEGRIVWARGYGVTEAGRRRPVTRETLFQAASISKPVAAVAIMRLTEAGLLDLDEDVSLRLRSWRVPENDLALREKVTLRRILSHRAGLTVHGFPGYARGEVLPSLPQILDGEAPANTAPVRVDLLPGSAERYSGGGTTVAELLLEDVLEHPFPEIMEAWVIGPAGMERSTYEQPLPANRSGEAARAHDREGRPVEGGWHTYPERAAAGLWTTPTELARLALRLQASLAGEEAGLLSRASARAMMTPLGGRFGIGFMVQGEGEEALFHHGGANHGFQALLLAFQEGGRGAVVMTNGANGGAIAREVVAAISASRGWPPPE